MMGLQQSVATSAPAEDGEGNTLISSNSSDSPDEEIRNKSDSFSFTQYFFKRRKRKKMELEDNISSKGDSDKKKIRQDKACKDETLELVKALEAEKLNDVKAGFVSEAGLEGNCPSSLSLPDAQKKIQEDLSKCEFLDFRIFNDEKTIRWVSENRCMVILRGLPGSGKTVITKKLVQLYSVVNVEKPVVCSADQFFVNEKGEYNYVASLIQNAHQESQEAARQAIENRSKMIIVDNTNVKVWNMRAYFQLAEKCPDKSYRVIVLEPQTTWALDPFTLVLKNKHSVTVDVLSKRISSYETLVPIYYAWFLSEHESSLLLKKSLELLKLCLESCEEFLQDFYKFSTLTSIEHALSYYNRDRCLSGNKSVLHCTAKFCGYENFSKKKLPPIKGKNSRKGPSSKASEKIDKKSLKIFERALCSVQQIQIIGFIMTKESFGARVKLDEDQLKIYDQDENIGQRQYGNPNQPSASRKIVDTTNEKVLRSSISIENSSNFYPVLGRGKRAHITLGTASNAKPVNTGLDVLEIVQMEKMCSEGKFEAKTFDLPNSSSKLRSYGKGFWALYTDHVYNCDGLYAGHY